MKMYDEEQIRDIIANCEARNLFDEDEDEAEKRRLALEFLNDTDKEQDLH